MKDFLIHLKWQVAVLLAGAFALFFHGLFIKFLPCYASWPLLLFLIGAALPVVFAIIIKLLKANPGADVLAAISIIAASVLGEYLAAVLVVLMLAGGQALEEYALGRASSVLKELAKRLPTVARRKRGDVLEDIQLSAIEISDLIMVSPHEASPVDGTVVAGHGYMDESYLTGEPYRVAKAPGASVLSGAVNGEQALLIRTEKLPKDSRYARIIKVMEEAEQKRPRLRRLGDQLGAIFAPIALALAVVAWYYSGDSMRFLSVLMIATPCPLLIAIPIAIISTISLAARRGIIISDPVVLERLPTCTTAIFDKTGTLTYGQPKVTGIFLAPGFSQDEVLGKVASLEQYSKHPLAKAILDVAHEKHLRFLETNNVTEIPGSGLSGIVGDHKVYITNRAKIALKNPDILTLLPQLSSGLECVVEVDDKYAATIQFHDAPKEDSRNFVHHLEPFHSFNKVILLSGDRESEVAYLAHELGIKETYASQSPEQKLAIVRAESLRAPTLFMGDGINDAPALRAATVGVAFGNPSAVTKEAAGAVVMEHSLSKVDELFHLSADMRKIALQSALFGMGLSLVGIIFALFGFITPVVGALLQQAIDALAILNALRLTWHKEVKIDLLGSSMSK